MKVYKSDEVLCSSSTPSAFPEMCTSRDDGDKLGIQKQSVHLVAVSSKSRDSVCSSKIQPSCNFVVRREDSWREC
jgi:hypothetical protein